MDLSAFKPDDFCNTNIFELEGYLLAIFDQTIGFRKRVGRRRLLIIGKTSIDRARLRRLVEARMPATEVLEASFNSFTNARYVDLVLVIGEENQFDLIAARQAAHSARFAIISSVSRAEEHRSGDEAVQALSKNADMLKLTARQREVLSLLTVLPLLTEGKSNKEIACALNIAEATAKSHIAALLRELGARNRTEAALKAARVLRNDPEFWLIKEVLGNAIKPLRTSN